MEAPADSIWSELLGYVIMSLGTILVALASWAVKKLSDKLGFELDEQKEEALRAQVRRAIGHAEEWARRRAKAGEGVTDGGEKLKFVLAIMERLAPNLTPDDLDRLIHEEIAFLRNVGASGNVLIDEEDRENG